MLKIEEVEEVLLQLRTLLAVTTKDQEEYQKGLREGITRLDTLITDYKTPKCYRCGTRKEISKGWDIDEGFIDNCEKCWKQSL